MTPTFMAGDPTTVSLSLCVQDADQTKHRACEGNNHSAGDGLQQVFECNVTKGEITFLWKPMASGWFTSNSYIKEGFGMFSVLYHHKILSPLNITQYRHPANSTNNLSCLDVRLLICYCSGLVSNIGQKNSPSTTPT